MPVSTVWALRAQPPGLPPAALWSVVGVALLAVLAWCGWPARYRYRPDPG